MQDLHSCRYFLVSFDLHLSYLSKSSFSSLPYPYTSSTRSSSSGDWLFNNDYWQPFVGRELFAAGFVSCWSHLNETSQRQLVRSLEMAFSSPNIPPEILATLLNLVRFVTCKESKLVWVQVVQFFLRAIFHLYSNFFFSVHSFIYMRNGELGCGEAGSVKYDSIQICHYSSF